MLAIGIAGLKTNLRKYIARVKKGEAIIITDHGKPVARLVPEEPQDKPLQQKLQGLARVGAVLLPEGVPSKSLRKPPAIRGKIVSEMVIEDRR